MPSWELFDRLAESEQEAVLPSDLPAVSVEAGIAMGWERFAAAHVSVETFGASAPAEVLMQKYGITADAVVGKVRGLLDA